MTPHNVVSGNRKSGNYSHEEIQRSQHYHGIQGNTDSPLTPHIKT